MQKGREKSPTALRKPVLQIRLGQGDVTDHEDPPAAAEGGAACEADHDLRERTYAIEDFSHQTRHPKRFRNKEGLSPPSLRKNIEERFRKPPPQELLRLDSVELDRNPVDGLT
jgi:hypothetical protein